MLLAESTFESILFGTLLFFVLVGARIGLHYIDKSSVNSAAQRKGWKQIEVSWCPFAPGWFFEKGERHYKVGYQEKDGTRKSKYCKTSLLTGVFWRD